jgi:hypothetical protein
MSTKVRSLLESGFGQVRYEPTAKRIRAVLDGATVLDSTRAVLVWEPRRVVPSYAVPVDDVRAELVAADPVAAAVTSEVGWAMPDVSSRPVLDPSIPFAVHTADGQAVDLRAGAQSGRPQDSAWPMRTWLATWCWTSAPSTPGTRRTSRT